MIARRLPAAGLAPLQERFEVDEGTLDLDRGELLRRVAGAAAIVPDWTVPIDAELLDAAGESLELVANFAVGYDHVDLDACREWGVVVTNTPGVLTNATAELNVALMMCAARRTGEMERMVRAGDWSGWDPEGLLGIELSRATIGIVGLGRIGTRVAELLQGFGARLLYTSRTAKPGEEARLGLERRELEQLVAESDVVSLNVALTPETRYLVDRQLLAHFKPGSILVNTTRGAVVDTVALVDALRDGPLGAAGLDVYEDEPNVPAELMELENVVLLPHLGSATRAARDAMARLAADNVIAVLAGDEPLTPIARV